MKQKILLVDDDPDILEFLSYNIKQEGYEIQTAENGIQALKKLENYKPDLIILDVMMPEMDGVETCQEIRNNSDFDDVIVTFLTARGEDYSQIVGFESGADDYITKPIKPKLLMSKIKSLLRRKDVDFSKAKNSDKKFYIDHERYLIISNGEEIILPKKEFEIITFLSSIPDKVFSREEIYEKIWGDNIIVGDRTIDVHIRKIRQKIGEEVIKTIKGVGYKFQIE
ncbi:MAG: response regulator transcription factor [Bacteroidales bacterium]|nr:response regulator transcription factor [Bacteroidales bacterium]